MRILKKEINECRECPAYYAVLSDHKDYGVCNLMVDFSRYERGSGLADSAELPEGYLHPECPLPKAEEVLPLPPAYEIWPLPPMQPAQILRGSIGSEVEYEEALKKINVLFESTPRDGDWGELTNLIDLVEKWEEEHYDFDGIKGEKEYKKALTRISQLQQKLFAKVPLDFDWTNGCLEGDRDWLEYSRLHKLIFQYEDKRGTY